MRSRRDPPRLLERGPAPRYARGATPDERRRGAPSGSRARAARRAREVPGCRNQPFSPPPRGKVRALADGGPPFGPGRHRVVPAGGPHRRDRSRRVRRERRQGARNRAGPAQRRDAALHGRFALRSLVAPPPEYEQRLEGRLRGRRRPPGDLRPVALHRPPESRNPPHPGGGRSQHDARRHRLDARASRTRPDHLRPDGGPRAGSDRSAGSNRRSPSRLPARNPQRPHLLHRRSESAGGRHDPARLRVRFTRLSPRDSRAGLERSERMGPERPLPTVDRGGSSGVRAPTPAGNPASPA